MTDEEARKEALRLAGAMADAALNLVGGEGLNFRVPAAPIGGSDAAATALRLATEAYNRHMSSWSLRKPSKARKAKRS